MTVSEAVMLSIKFRRERPSPIRSIGRRMLVAGIGINDADYSIGGAGGWCPAYTQWQNMIKRCYSEKVLKKHPSYIGCSVAKEWLNFMGFREWWVKNHVDGWAIDKDLLIFGNREYGPEACCFVPRTINNFLVNGLRSRGDLPIGVCYDAAAGKLRAYCRDSGRLVHLGLFDDAESAHGEWRSYKLMLLERLRPEMDSIDTRIYITAKRTILEAK